jgi:hypothetical protein
MSVTCERSMDCVMVWVNLRESKGRYWEIVCMWEGRGAERRLTATPTSTAITITGPSSCVGMISSRLNTLAQLTHSSSPAKLPTMKASLTLLCVSSAQKTST